MSEGAGARDLPTTGVVDRKGPLLFVLGAVFALAAVVGLAQGIGRAERQDALRAPDPVLADGAGRSQTPALQVTDAVALGDEDLAEEAPPAPPAKKAEPPAPETKAEEPRPAETRPVEPAPPAPETKAEPQPRPQDDDDEGEVPDDLPPT